MRSIVENPHQPGTHFLHFRIAALTRIRKIHLEIMYDPARRTCHHQGAVSHQDGLVDIVGNQDNVDTELLGDLAHIVLESGTGEGIQCREGLIQEQHLWFHDQ